MRKVSKATPHMKYWMALLSKPMWVRECQLPAAALRCVSVRYMSHAAAAPVVLAGATGGWGMVEVGDLADSVPA